LADPELLVPVIAGPTAIGKTEVAVQLSRSLPLTVISADSRQVYRSLDIGTAKPSPRQLALVEHLGIDVVDPGEVYSAGRFASDVAGWLREIPVDRQAVVVGGTGFYIHALVEGLFEEPPMDSVKREQLRAWSKSAAELGRWAARLDPGFAGGGRQRAARVVEVAMLTGRPLSWWHRRGHSVGVICPWYIRLTAPRAELHNRIEQRVEGMLDGGLVGEVEALLRRGIPPGAPGLDGVGYREVIEYLDGRLRREQLAAAISQSTRRYAKRQETWFRHQLTGGPVLTFEATETPEVLAERIFEQWKKRDWQCESD
jgi:tRNA dimethylallyltransferase